MTRIFALCTWIAIMLQATILPAAYKDDVGFSLLAEELGAGLPDGTGVVVTQIEALSNDHWTPDTGNVEFDGKTITDKTGGDTGSSGHATGVGTRFYGNTTSTTPGVTSIDVYETSDWLQLGFLGTRYLYGGNPFQPVYDINTTPWTLSTPARVANHSWVGSMSGYDGDILRRVDFVAAGDQYIQITAVNNGTANRPLVAHAFNSISVGRTDGGHPMGTMAIDSLYAADRTLPLLVTPMSTTSSSAPVVASAAALLVQTGRNPSLGTDPTAVFTTNRSGDEIFNGERADVIKAALLAGARRITYNAQSTDQITDYRQDAANGMDRRFGAGQLNIYNSYHIIAAGEQNNAEDQPANGGAIGARGFDVDYAFGGNGGSNITGCYFFTPDSNQRRIFASLVWNLHVDGGTSQHYDSSAQLYNLDLKLYDETVTGYDRLVAASSSTLDNTENLWAELVPGRNYRMEVNIGEGQAAFEWAYALAWHMETPSDSDGDGIPDDWEVQNGLDHTQPSDGDLDPDTDDLTNAQEYENGTDPDSADSDGDGQTDGVEVLYQSDPLNPNDTAEIPSVPVAGVVPGYLAMMVLLAVGVGSLSVKRKLP